MDHLKNFRDVIAMLQKLTSKTKTFEWTAVHQAALEKVKEMLLEASPVLGYPSYNLPFDLYCDTSHIAVGGTLTQTQNGRKVALKYMSKTLKLNQLAWPAYKKEFYAICVLLRDCV